MICTRSYAKNTHCSQGIETSGSMINSSLFDLQGLVISCLAMFVNYNNRETVKVDQIIFADGLFTTWIEQVFRIFC